MGVNRRYGESHTHVEYVNSDPDYTKCPNCKKKDEAYDKRYNESYTNNPDPSKYTILDHKQFGPFLALKVVYDNIKESRYERIKIMVLLATPIDLLKRKVLDPHFEKDGIVMARFQPTEEGWKDALQYADNKYLED